MKGHAFLSPITPHDCIFVLLNYQTKFASTIDSRDVQSLIETTLLLVKTAEAFQIPIVLTTIGANTYGGPLLTPLRMAFPNMSPIDCSTLSVWEDRKFAAVLEKIARRKLVIAGFWTNFSVTLSTIQALQAGYEVYVVFDACAELSDEENEIAVQRMLEAGAVLTDSFQILQQFRDCQQSSHRKRMYGGQ